MLRLRDNWFVPTQRLTMPCLSFSPERTTNSQPERRCGRCINSPDHGERQLSVALIAGQLNQSVSVWSLYIRKSSAPLSTLSTYLGKSVALSRRTSWHPGAATKTATKSLCIVASTCVWQWEAEYYAEQDHTSMGLGRASICSLQALCECRTKSENSLKRINKNNM